MEGFRANWFDAAGHDEIKQLRGEAPSAFTLTKLEFGCLMRRAIVEGFRSGKLEAST